MLLRTVMLVATFFGMVCGLAHADFKYTQSAQFTNGIAQAKAAFGTQPADVTIYVQGAFLRIDLPDDMYGIIDLDGRKEIQVDPKTRTYSIVTFEEIRNRDKEASQQFPSHITQDLALAASSTGKTLTLLDQTARNTKVEIRNSTQASTIDCWVAPSVGSFNEVKVFYERVASAIRSDTDTARFPALHGVAELMMAVESGVNSLAVWPAVMSKGILDLCKVANAPDGLPLLQIYREYAVASPSEAQKGAANRGKDDALADSGATGAVPVDSEAQSGEGPPQKLVTEFTLRITSFSPNTLEKGLFQIPPSYKETHMNLRDMWLPGVGQ